MKKRLLFVLLLVLILSCALIMSACTFTVNGVTYGFSIDDLFNGGKTDPTDNTNPKSPRTVDFYAINDFHGATDRMSQVGGYLTSVKDGNTLLINSGDMFQGSMESNSNYGKLLSECMDIVGFDAFTYGNHEFDWGLEKLTQLANNSETPFLGANIYHWNQSDRTFGTFASELAKEYVVKTLDNGLKVGIIGVIGQDQITSISTNLVQTIGFKDPVPIIKTLSTKLRNDLDCDIVVVSAHCGPDGLVTSKNCTYSGNYISGVKSSNGLSSYVDAVFCAHSHALQDYVVDGIPFIQGKAYGAYVSNVRLSVDAHGKVTCTKHSNIQYQSNWQNNYDIMAEIDNSNVRIADQADQVLATTNGDLSSGTAIPRLVAHAMATYALQCGYDVDIAICNTGRYNIYNGDGKLTYSELYQTIPFDNLVYVAKVTGRDLISEANYSSNGIWRVNENAFYNDSSHYYTIAVIDYMLFHQNGNRVYNYFPSAFEERNTFTPVALTKQGVDVYNYRLITRDFLLKKGSINTSLYSNTNNNTDTTKLLQSVTLTTTVLLPQQDSVYAVINYTLYIEPKRYCYF